MKKTIFITLMLLFAMLTSACSNSSSQMPTISPLSTVTAEISNNTPIATLPAVTQNISLPADAINKTPISFNLKDVNGNTISSSSFNGKPTIINFFATWCGYCENEMPYFVMLEDEYGDRINVVYIDTLDDVSVSDLKLFFSDRDMDYSNVLIDEDSKLLTAYGYAGVPVSLILDSNGVIHKIRFGAFSSYMTLKNYMVNYGQIK